MSGVHHAELIWAVRESFVSYVASLPDGVIHTGGGAERDGHAFRLHGRRVGPWEYRFDGSLHFRAHLGVLDVTLDEIRVLIRGGAGTVSARVAGARLPIAEIAGAQDLREDTTVQCREATLTDDGVAILGGVYPPGTPAAPITIHVAS